MYEANITSSLRELTAREKIVYKNVDGQKLNEIINNDNPSIDLDVENIVELQVHNERSKGNNDYTVYVIDTKDGSRYRTGSETFYTKAKEIYRELQAANELENGFVLRVFKTKSNNFDGDFINCRLV